MSEKSIDLQDPDQAAGAVYFVVGRGTEGGNASYHLSITGVTNAATATDPGWNDIDRVIAQSGYTLGSIQVDLGQRGMWALGAIDGRRLQPGEKTYVQAVIDEASNYAKSNGLPFTNDHAQLRKDLLSHGPNLIFIDTDTRDAINWWASSNEGKQWIHQNIDLPQVRNATKLAVDTVEMHGNNIPEDRRFEVVCMLAKTANQLPGKLSVLEKSLANGSDYDQFIQSVNAIKAKSRFYSAGHAGTLASTYEANYQRPEFNDSMNRAHWKVMSATYDPSQEAYDVDIQRSLNTINRGTRPKSATIDARLQQGERGAEVRALQQSLNKLGATDDKGRALVENGLYTEQTREAVESFQREHGLHLDGIAGPETLSAVHLYASVPNPTYDAVKFGQQFQPGPHPPINLGAKQVVDGMPDYLRANNAYTHVASAPAARERDLPRHIIIPPSPAEPATLPALPTTQTLEPGDRSAAVQALQQHLRLLGATDRYGQQIKDDRDYGDSTREAVEQFQLWTGREPTGIADPDTLKAVQSQAQFALRQRGHGIVVAPDAHLTDHLRPTALERTDAAIERPVQGRDQAGLTPFSDPHHPQHALYADVQQRFQAKGHDLSEAQLSALTGQMHLGGYKPGWPGDVIVYQGKAVVGNEYLARQMMSVELNASTPSVQEAMQTFQAEHQSLAQHMERMNQQQAMAQEHGRTV
ncbi:peptidoglycan-binding protein [Luteimonas sp. SX5]|uniref:Peptidoglycan-binding protein n=1 Tax=Luteimonas galliterrae TaxID=2940486 RepID=A0ABT0MN98_9GAMM|nr:peptidoglycan-binding protein [Luteimonas galliterrae]MCL1635734.1 peptidoglycan-binding protein [Luteimonas galliterrae]